MRPVNSVRMLSPVNDENTCRNTLQTNNGPLTAWVQEYTKVHALKRETAVGA